jgi:Tfp pilus assembly protein PilE
VATFLLDTVDYITVNAAKSIYGIRSRSGFTLVDVMVAVMILAGSFSALYALGGQCVYLISSGKELTSGQQLIQDRIEQLRNLQWTQVTDPNYLANSVLNQARQNGNYLKSLTETVTIYSYPPPAAPPTPTPIQLTISTNGTVAINTTNSTIANGNLCRIDVTETWTAGRTGQTRSVTNTTVQANKSR